MQRAWGTAVPVAALALLAGCGGDGGTPDPGPAATTPVRTSPAAPARPLTGIGEQGAAMFGAPRFRALGVRHARLVVPWDATAVRFERDLADAWLNAARAAGVEPFVTFGHSRVRPRALPTPDAYRAAVRAFRARHPEVTVYAPWNEINHASQPTSDAPARAAAYYNVLRRECPGCTVLAGDLLDQRGMLRYLAAYRRHLDGEPAIWGLHNYADANRFRSRGLRALLGAVPGRVWLTETGGIVRFGRSFPRSPARAARGTAYVLRLARRTPRVDRVYLYNWTAAGPDARFDSGLVGPGGAPRPAYEALRRALRG